MSTKISLQQLLDSGAHFGHQAKRWNPKMAQYLYGVQDGVHVFDLTKTKEALEEALAAIKKASSEGKTILLLGSKKQATEKIAQVGKDTLCPYVSERWLGGTISNFEQIKKSIKKLTEMKNAFASGDYDKFTKKEKLLLQREKDRLERFFGGISNLDKKPDMLVIVDSHKEKSAIKEARKAGIVIVGIVDSNADPSEVDYPIPMNDDATKAILYVLDLIKEAILEGKKGVGKQGKISKIVDKEAEAEKNGKN